MPPQNKVWKSQPTKDGRNAKQRRADKKRAARLASEPHLNHVATAQKNRIRKQSNRWLNYNLGADDLCERVEKERAEAKRAAGVGPEEWVNDWFGPGITAGPAGAGESTTSEAGAERKAGDGMEQEIERETENKEGKEPDDRDEDKEENPDYMEGVERGVSRLEL